MSEVDLHLHTTNSDGTLSPAELIQLCARRGLTVVAVTDHDSTEGIPEALKAAQQHSGLTVIPGIELSTDVPGAEVHLLGYFVDYQDPDLQDELRRMRAGRRDRALGMIEKLETLGVKVSWARVRELAGDGAIGRPHIAQAMVEAGYVQYPRDAFEAYLGRNGPAYVERTKLTPADAVRMLVRNGALPVMAHPGYSVDIKDPEGPARLSSTLTELKDAGLVGMEVYYKDYPPKQVRMLAAMAGELGLVPCGGTDYHASGNPDEMEPGSAGPPLDTAYQLRSLWERRRATVH